MFILNFYFSFITNLTYRRLYFLQTEKIKPYQFALIKLMFSMIDIKTSQKPITTNSIPKLGSSPFSIGTITVRNLLIILFVIGLLFLFAISIFSQKVLIAVITGIVLLLSGFVISNLFYLNGSNKRADTFNRMILENSSDLFLTYKIKKGKFNFVSPTIRQLLGFDSTSVLNHYDLSFIHPADRLELRSILNPTYLRLNRNFDSTVRMIKRDGHTIWVKIKGDVIVDEKNELDTVILNLRDITEDKTEALMSDQYRKSLEQIIQKNNITEKNAKELSTLMSSHDLKEPLRTMSNYTRMVQQRYTNQLGEDGKELLQYAVDAANRMAYMMDDILSLSLLREDKIRIREVSLEKAISDAKFELSKKIKSSEATIIYGNLPTIQADSTQMKELFKQIIGNSIKYRGKENPIIRIDAEQHTDNWLIKISDNGIGISEEFQDSIFNFFRRLHAIGDLVGSGLGLPICKKIVSNHGGNIWVESEGEGKGSTFCFMIPVDPVVLNFSEMNNKNILRESKVVFEPKRFQF